MDTALTAKQMRDDLKGLIDSDDELLGDQRLDDGWATCGINDSGNQW